MVRLRRLGLNQVHAPTSRSRLLRSQLLQRGPIIAQLVLRGSEARAHLAWELEGSAVTAGCDCALSGLVSCKSMPPSNVPRLERGQQLGPVMAQLVLRGSEARALMAGEIERVFRLQTGSAAPRVSTKSMPRLQICPDSSAVCSSSWAP